MTALPLNDRDRDMILNPRKWPQVILPLKKSGAAFQSGGMAIFAPPMNVLEISPTEKIVILIGTMFDDLRKLPTQEYENVDALLRDGWIVD